jgi:hypothetical protein
LQARNVVQLWKKTLKWVKARNSIPDGYKEVDGTPEHQYDFTHHSAIIGILINNFYIKM